MNTWAAVGLALVVLSGCTASGTDVYGVTAPTASFAIPSLDATGDVSAPPSARLATEVAVGDLPDEADENGTVFVTTDGTLATVAPAPAVAGIEAATDPLISPQTDTQTASATDPAGTISSTASTPDNSIPEALASVGADSAAGVAEVAALSDPGATVATQGDAGETATVAMAQPLTADTPSIQPAQPPAPAPVVANAAAPVGQNLFSRLFSKRPSNPVRDTQLADRANDRIAAAAPAPEPRSTPRPQAVVTASPAPQGTIALAALPGVKDTKSLFLIDEVEPEDEDAYPDVRLASATPAGLARLAPNGIRTQTDRVEVDCFKPELVRVLRNIEQKFGKPVIVTSGYRSPRGNRNSGGASKSLHMFCAAADIQIEGVSKWTLANYLRGMPGRGGVGTYCHTDSVHIDIGSKRDWNWRCRRR